MFLLKFYKLFWSIILKYSLNLFVPLTQLTLFGTRHVPKRVRIRLTILFNYLFAYLSLPYFALFFIEAKVKLINEIHHVLTFLLAGYDCILFENFDSKVIDICWQQNSSLGLVCTQ